MFSHYHVLERIGEGSFGKVSWSCNDNQSNLAHLLGCMKTLCTFVVCLPITRSSPRDHTLRVVHMLGSRIYPLNSPRKAYDELDKREKFMEPSRLAFGGAIPAILGQGRKLRAVLAGKINAKLPAQYWLSIHTDEASNSQVLPSKRCASFGLDYVDKRPSIQLHVAQFRHGDGECCLVVLAGIRRIKRCNIETETDSMTCLISKLFCSRARRHASDLAPYPSSPDLARI